MNYEDNPKSIKYHVKKYLLKNQQRFAGKKIVDFPAGNGVTSKIIQDIGAVPIPFDLFPEYFNINNLTCERANIDDCIPLEDKQADAVICQEGIEHFSNQLKALREFNRIIKDNGALIITTPNYSNLRARMSYMLSESERFNSTMPPNELDSIWMSDQKVSNEIYFGHIFLIGIQKLRVLAKLAGFRIKHIQPTRIKTTSLLLFLFFYPFILLSNGITYIKNLKKNKTHDYSTKKKIYGEQFRLAISPTILLNSHLFVEFEKEQDFEKVAQQLQSIHRSFQTST